MKSKKSIQNNSRWSGKKPNSPPLVSIVIPCYNQGQYLSETIDSALSQEHTNIEVVIVNDGSTDRTLKICNKYAAKDQRVRFVSQKNKGLSNARNLGVKLSKGNYIQLLDSDDIILPQKIKQQVKLMERDKSVGASYCNFSCFCGGNKKCLTPDVSPKMQTDDALNEFIIRWEEELSIPCHCFLFRKNVFNGIKFDDKLPTHEDWDCWIKMALKRVRFHYMPKVFALYRLHSHSKCGDHYLMGEGRMMVLIKLFKSKKVDREYKPVILQKLKDLIRQI